MTVSADRRGWGRGWPQNNSSKMVGVRAMRSGTVLLVHKEIAPIVRFCLDTIEARGYLFDHGPKDPTDDWGYANRPIRGTLRPSNHSWGLAVDLDATKYPQGQNKKRLPEWVIDVFDEYRFDSGNWWDYPDPMHMEFNGTLDEARWLVASLAAHSLEFTEAPMPPSAPAVKPTTSPPPYFGKPPPARRKDKEMLVRNTTGNAWNGEVWLLWPNKTRELLPASYVPVAQKLYGPPVDFANQVEWDTALSIYNKL